MVIKVLSFLTIIAIAAYIEISKMKKQKMKKEIIIYSVFLLTSVILFSLDQMNVPFFNPLEAIKFIFQPVGKLIENLFTV